jgi:hypothetical protein
MLCLRFDNADLYFNIVGVLGTLSLSFFFAIVTTGPCRWKESVADRGTSKLFLDASAHVSYATLSSADKTTPPAQVRQG